MGTLVCFHAHPDDEAITTGGSMARAHADGHRVVLVVATDGDHGERPDDLAAGETLPARRRRETADSAAVLGVDRVEFLGYRDSGMTGWEQNADPDCFARADVDEAAGRLADLLRAERPDVLTGYDWHGNYGHPDHVQVHHVTHRAARLVSAELPQMRVMEATVNRDHLKRMVDRARADGTSFAPEGSEESEFDPEQPMDDGNPMGLPEAELTLAVDVSDFVDAKRRAIAAHRSQVTDSSFFLQMPLEMFAAVFGREWFRELDRAAGLRDGWLFDR